MRSESGTSSSESDINSSDSSLDDVGSDSDVGSETSSLSDVGFTSEGPQPATKRPPMPGLTLPKLDIKLANIETESPTPRSAPMPAIPISNKAKIQNISPQSTPETAIELLSPAFSLSNTQLSRRPTDIQTQCASKFGIRSDRVRLYALVEIDTTNTIPVDCKRLAIEVQGCDCSLQAIEEVLTENQRLAQELHKTSKDIVMTPSTLQNTKNTAIGNDIEQLKQEISVLKKRLSNSEMLRHKGRQALQELKEEFETLHFDLLSSPSPASSFLSPRF